MNWFAIGAGIAMVVVALVAFARKADGSSRLPRPAAIAIGISGLFFLILGASPTYEI